MVSSQLEGGERDPEQRPKVVVTILDNDSHMITDGFNYCGIYDESAGVCRECNWYEWALAYMSANPFPGL